MSALKISRVMAVSSEDPQFPATNLLTGGEWRCLGTEEEAWVLLLLEEPSFITDIGFRCVNEVASIEVKVASIEVKVGDEKNIYKIISWRFRLEMENGFSQRKWKFYSA